MIVRLLFAAIDDLIRLVTPAWMRARWKRVVSL